MPRPATLLLLCLLAGCAHNPRDFTPTFTAGHTIAFEELEPRQRTGLSGVARRFVFFRTIRGRVVKTAFSESLTDQSRSAANALVELRVAHAFLYHQHILLEVEHGRHVESPDSTQLRDQAKTAFGRGNYHVGVRSSQYFAANVSGVRESPQYRRLAEAITKSEAELEALHGLRITAMQLPLGFAE